MEELQKEITNPFLENGSIKHQDSLCMRFLRKKFKCIIIWFLLFITLAQCFLLIIDKISAENFNSMLSIMLAFKNNKTDTDKIISKVYSLFNNTEY